MFIERYSKAHIRQNQVLERFYKPRKQDWTEQEIIKEVQKFQKEIKDDEEEYKDIRMMVTCHHNGIWRSGGNFGADDPNILLDDYDWSVSDMFIIYAWFDDVHRPRGGDDEHNDCLLNCIFQRIGKYRLPKEYKTSESIKTKLGLNRDDKISLAIFPRIERLLKINLNCSGDFTFTSINKFQMSVNVILENEHYTLDKEIDTAKELKRGLEYNQKQLIVSEEKDGIITTYDGLQKKIISQDELHDLNKSKYIKTSEFALVKHHKLWENKKLNVKTIEDKYNIIIQECEILNDLTHGKFDISKSHYLTQKEAIKSLYFALQPFDEAEPLTKQEQHWICLANKGGLIKNYENGKELECGYEYDLNSYYPFLMSSSTFTFPIKQGEFTQIKELPTDFFKYGIYRVVIEKCSDDKNNNLFRFNYDNFYTHYDLTFAKQLGLKMELIIDGEANCLYYEKDRLNGHTVFHSLITQLYQLKGQSALAKLIMNTLWGALSTKDVNKQNTRYQEVDMTDDDVVEEIYPYGEDDTIITYTKRDKTYKYGYARIGAFLTSYGRGYLGKIAHPFKNYIHRIHTDSILSSVKLPLQVSTGLGHFKLANEGKCILHHVNDIEPFSNKYKN